jgi:acyl dehydratase
MTCKAITDRVLDGDAAAVDTYGARFAGVVFPGETLRANVWKDHGRYVATVVAPGREDAAVLTGVELIPK